MTVPDVTGLDSDSAVLESARGEDPEVTWIHGDLMTHPLALGSFDVVASVATLHHFSDLDLVLARLAELTAPGGVVAVVGLAKSSSPIDFAYDVAGFFQHGWHKRRRGMWEHSAPTVWPPPHSYADVRRSAARVLPGAHWHRLAMWRYALIWSKPTD